MILSFLAFDKYINHIIFPFSYGIEQVSGSCSSSVSLLNHDFLDYPKTHKLNFIFASRSSVTDPPSLFFLAVLTIFSY